MATDKILQFLQDQNRPFSLNDIAQSVAKDLTKFALQKSVDKLVRKGQVTEKVFGKQKIYCIAQDDDMDANQISEEIRKLDRQIKEMSAKLEETDGKLKASRTTLSKLGSVKSLAEYVEEKNQIEREIGALKGELVEFERSSHEQVEAGTKEDLLKKKGLVVKEYKKSKRICLDMMDAILEGYPKSKKHFMEETGLEIVEDVGDKLV